jgi:metallophosphoesterase, MG_246/BB_0505 family
MRFLFFGDIVGGPGRAALKARLPRLRETLRPAAVIANAENAAGGIGLTRETAQELFGAGVDVATGGNHSWRHAEVYTALDQDERILRPANVHPSLPGRGVAVRRLSCGTSFAVINLLGRVFMDPADCPFRAAEAALAAIPAEVALRFVDFHAEATSEKRAMGLFLAGRVTAVVGTHTHVQTADAAILPGGTAYITDMGMCGAEKPSILGMEPKTVIDRFVTGMPGRFKPVRAEGLLNGVIIDADPATGQAKAIHILREQPPVLWNPASGEPAP